MATATNLYRYLPTFIRIHDRLASNLADDDPAEAVLEKLVAILVSIFDENDDFIKALLDLGDPDRVDQAYFSHITYLLGTMLPSGGNEQSTRFIIKQLVNHYKTKGTHLSWHRAWAWQNVPDARIAELYKHELNEIGEYSAFQSVNHPYKSARIRLGACTTSCESICESTCESSCEEDVQFGTELSHSAALERMSHIEYLRPIHVLLRLDAEDVQVAESLPGTQETLGHHPPEYNPEPWMGSEVEATIEEEAPDAIDEFESEQQCVGTCEVACQSCCEVECECDPCEVACQVGGCELSCTDSCEQWCEFPCEGSCVHGCTSCQAACTSACASGCTSCEGACAAACQAACTTSDCEGHCQGGACQDSYCMEGKACQVGYCASGDCQGNCASSCEAACTTSGCEGHCQAADSCQTSYCMAGSCQDSTCKTDSCESAYCTNTNCQSGYCASSDCQGGYCMAVSCEVSYCTAGGTCQSGYCTSTFCQFSYCMIDCMLGAE